MLKRSHMGRRVDGKGEPVTGRVSLATRLGCSRAWSTVA
jgi:hypothetical protein